MKRAIILLFLLVILSCKQEEPAMHLGIWSLNKGTSGLLSDEVSSQWHGDFELLWYGTYSGLSRMNEAGWTDYSVGTGWLTHDSVSCLGQWENELLIGTLNGGVNRLLVNGVDAISGASAYDTIWTGLISARVQCILVDSHGVKWFGTPKGISLHEGDNSGAGWTDLTTAVGLVSNDVSAIAEDPSGDIWIGTEQGLSVYMNGTIVNYATGTPVENRRINAIHVHTPGIGWLGCMGGLYQLDRSGTGDNWDEIPMFGESNIHAIYQDHMEDLWIGSDEGLVLYREGGLVFENDLEVFKGLQITSIVPLQENWVGVTTLGGVFVIEKPI